MVNLGIIFCSKYDFSYSKYLFFIFAGANHLLYGEGDLLSESTPPLVAFMKFSVYFVVIVSGCAILKSMTSATAAIEYLVQTIKGV